MRVQKFPQKPLYLVVRAQPKKKRKSRTAFTNHQIFELEKRFLYQKYLSPADRDEIAAALGLSNAQVRKDHFRI
uniref:CSON012245 protein n=1 Tax=Culicoides sonorensis TaxID=179676 RepID=A0A336N4Z1_CULSO